MSKKITIEYVKEQLKTINPNIKILSTEYVNAHSKLKCKCLIDNYEWETTWNSLQQGIGCPLCKNKIVVEGINDIPTTAPWMIPYFQGGYDEAKLYTRQSNKKVQPICSDCGRVKDKPMSICGIYKSHSTNCLCGDGVSYISKYMFDLLHQLEVNFDTEIKYNWCKFFNPFKQKETYGFYDFVLEDIKLIIETDGDFHRINNKMNGQTKEESELIDDEKDRLALKNGYKIIRISDEGDIKQNIVDSNLTILFDLSNIDWIKCEKFASNNRIKEACRLKSLNSNMTTTDIGNILKLNRNTITRYLKKGNKLGWCNYTVESEAILTNENRRNNCKKRLSKPISIFKDGIQIEEFESIMECERQSEKLFGIKLCGKNISAVLKGKRSHHKGFTFQYINEERRKLF